MIGGQDVGSVNGTGPEREREDRELTRALHQEPLEKNRTSFGLRLPKGQPFQRLEEWGWLILFIAIQRATVGRGVVVERNPPRSCHACMVRRKPKKPRRAHTLHGSFCRNPAPK